MSNKIKCEFTGGELKTPEGGSIGVPPKNTGRKDLEEGELLLVAAEIPQKGEITVVANAKNHGIMEIPTVAMTGTTKVNTTITLDDIENKVDFGR